MLKPNIAIQKKNVANTGWNFNPALEYIAFLSWFMRIVFRASQLFKGFKTLQ